MKIMRSWQPNNFKLETGTVWRFPERGSWATHTPKYRGNFSPYVPRNLILRYSKKGDMILDQFAGGGTTLIEAKLLGRNIIGVDVNTQALCLCKSSTNFEYDNSGKVYLRKGDARNLEFIPDERIDFICTHPPYADAIKYSKDIVEDISLLDYESFLKEMEKVAKESYRVLKKGKYCAILMGDIRKNGNVIPLGFEVMNIFKNIGFINKEIIIKEQYNCKSTDYWIKKSFERNFLLLEHEYLFVFKK